MRAPKIVFLFSGQGSHYRKMGQKLYHHNEVFRKSIEKSDALIKDQLGRSLIEELYEHKIAVWDDLLITHPAIVAVEIAMYAVMKAMDIQPDYICGYSLGEFAAAVADEVWDDQTAVLSSVKQAQSLIDSNIRGGMLTILHQRNKDLIAAYNKYHLFLVSDNFEDHFTVSGTIEKLEAFQSELEANKIQVFNLSVKVPFHSPLVRDGFSNFSHYMKTTRLNKPTSRFISGARCSEMDTISHSYFEEVVSAPMDYSKIITFMESKGPNFYIDLGPSGTCATFAKYNLSTFSESKCFQIMTPFQRELNQLEELKNILKKVY
ncbi:acyltransferase domain-containing protein [Aquimarina aggregata]|uniref:acyltransferase domain-containing protein n=1 Tax=Aquimarina aggregata TaxID=1642818 RepID=UPI0024918B4B|nr:acyltransferase domain-containing protein [Aquimarina aggregata]